MYSAVNAGTPALSAKQSHTIYFAGIIKGKNANFRI